MDDSKVTDLPAGRQQASDAGRATRPGPRALLCALVSILSARDTLSLAGELRRLNYIYPSLPWAGRPGSGPGGGDAKGQGRGAVAVRRNDRLLGLEAGLEHSLTPGLSAALSVALARCDSPVAADAYDRAGTGLVLRAQPAPGWPLELGLGWARTRYDRSAHAQERVDTERTAGLALRRTLGRYELLCGLDRVDSDSTVAGRSFRQRVARCGLAWSW